MGCLAMGNDRYIEGNVRDEKLRNIWNDPEKFIYNRGFSVDDLGENCAGCKFGDQCRGGCASMSRNISGGLHNDPYCFRSLEKKL